LHRTLYQQSCLGEKQITMTVNIAFRLDGGHALGLGNVVRCLSLAEELGRRFEAHCLFVMRYNAVAMGMVKKSGWPVAPISDDTVSDSASIYRQFKPDVIFNDILYTTSDYMKAANQIAPTINYDDIGQGRTLASVVIDATPKPDPSGLGDIPYYHGPDYLMLRTQFRDLRESGFKRDVIRQPDRVLIMMGGSDPTGLTLRAVDDLNILDRELELSVVVGSAYGPAEKLKKSLQESRHRTFLRSDLDVTSLIHIMQEADIGIAHCGTTAYEMASLGLPFVAIAHNDEEDKLGRVGEFGFCVYLGIGRLLKPGDIGKEVSKLLGDRELRLRLSETGMVVVDSRGAIRVADIIMNTVNR
jgi:spore coat polysaccharide biosynthesis predicted glycosyltransferase SpsG